MNQELNQESKKDISDKWIAFICEHLQRLEELEVSSKQGCENMLEYVNIPVNQMVSLPVMQLKNIGFWISEFEITLKDVRAVLKKTEAEALENKLNLIKNTKEKGFKIKETTIKISKVLRNSQTKKRKVVLLPLFEVVVNQLSNLRGELIENLKHILWIQKSESKSGEE